jgi:hypothetical protein
MLDATGFCLSIFYIVVLIAVLIYISKRLKVGVPSETIVLFFLYYYFFFIFSTFMPLVPDLPDTELFGKIISENYFPPHQSLGVRLFYAITYPLRVLSLFKIEIFILFEIFIFTIALMILWKSWQIVLRENNKDETTGVNLFFFLSAIYPAFLLYIPIPLREFFILLGFSIMIYGIVRQYYLGTGISMMLLGSVLLMFGRPQLIVIVIIFLALFQKNRVLKYALIATSIFIIPLLFSKLTSYQFTPEFFAYLRNVSNSNHGILAYGTVEWSSYLDIVLDLPLLFFQFILSPFPILHERNPISFFAIFGDALYSILIYIAVLYAGFKLSRIYLFLFLVSAVIFGIWEFHIAGAARHRMPLVAILLPVASYGLMKLYYDIQHYRKRKE